MKAREIADALRAELESHGAEFVRLDVGGKHNRIVFMWKGEEIYCAYSQTPSARGAIQGALHDLRALMGVKRQTDKNPANRNRTRNRQDPAPVIVKTPARENPFDALRAWKGRGAPREIARPRPGFFRVRLIKGGPWVAARIFQPCPIEMEPEYWNVLDRSPSLEAEINGLPGRVMRIWLSGEEISAAEFHYLLDDAGWCERYAPAEPRANPERAVDVRETQPVF